MRCKKCGFEVFKNDLFCPNCGTKIEPESNKKSNNKIKLIIAAVVIVICAGGVGYFLVNNNSDNNTNDNKEVVSDQEKDEEKDDIKKDEENQDLVICQGNLDEITTNTTTIEATNDKVNVMKAEVVYDVTNYVSDQYSIDYWLSQLKSINVDYNSLQGASASWDVNGTIITMNVEIDYDKADFDELLAAGVLTSTDESKKIVYVSLDETIKQQENSGLVCKKQ
ncbi:DUF1307 domain-containing protein [uncultured Thomasclavelia sp.]|uniref:DUF1307 domain-containing protein n=1 Tax=uncultured Thomasclavelia sp. TaxID=3025759 RepID=UPI002621AB0E|nr:DUF1307 domain-containing protein [uncultured Thomasclavelia sp.]